MSGLARGLGALLPQKESLTSQVLPELAKDGMQEIPVAKISENPFQPRKHFSASEMDDLMVSIKEHGILQPLIVTRRGDGFELIAGERRLRAARDLGMAQVPAVVRTASDQEKLELALIENIQRQQLGALEEAVAYKALIEEFNLTQAAAAERVGKSRSEVANTMRLLDLPEAMKSALRDGKITRTHARTLLSETDPAKRETLFQAMLAGGLTVRQAEGHVGIGTKRLGKKGADPNLAAHAAKLREVFGTKVEIDTNKVSFFYYSKEELRDLLSRLIDL
ncbi:ParB/RepB/Spo0J family partition protein [Candidatus Uhrbacteria bacterium]|nr:ParB/RepB/Spo0J family partition protein [Candidatus Uhrbacteria bacterium]